MTALADKAQAFRDLHHSGRILILPNAWDAGSAVVFAAEGYPAVATTSAGIAFAAGLPDGERIDRDMMLHAVSLIAGRLSVPVSADLEAGFGDTPDAVAQTIAAVLAAGAVGVNIEDGLAEGLRPMAEQVERLKAVRAAADAAAIPLFINARTDVYWQQVGTPEERLGLTMERLRAYREAGADGLFVPGRLSADEIAAIVGGAGLPVNLLGGPGMPTIPEMAALGVARVTVGSGPSRAILGLTRAIARELRDSGTYAAIAGNAIPYPEVQRLLSE
ncbi:isocitrate lyase/phosphoenolpyruvate mutase family protein [Azospirillum sp. RWY-5-1]|uniref:Isocitrate lyase/phosphoenolpyruvate mutase family protein n=1 Tax=Azospirillum oleiclasticum TaxID=2735135 RepID=A0ABX2TEA7_9PROT|nr:isocitrate lyase/phosphoenolpyruvate mutase family protein [Azospirillum oleiclasticum]NYZ15456.1 isocitrate lyase/phosphoenolpyruvate mutase family protein [Azospirillum oleiclasticum]NYZ22479.1 isocitrate lyase/phosphoenolpyruvate mutase family protein [Azospirillum oleiclasticum]